MSEAWSGSSKPAHVQQRGKRATKRFGSTRWNGGLPEGKGAVSTESRALENYPCSFLTRYGQHGRPEYH